MPILSGATAPVADGAYVIEQQSRPSLPQAPASNTLAIVGCFTDGPMNVPTPISTVNGAGPALAQFGSGSTISFAGIRELLSAMPEVSSFILVRVGDGTQAQATLAIKDTATPTPGTLVTLTAVNPGSEANKATAQVTLQSGTMAAAPVFQVAINYPNNNPVVYKGIVGYATAGGPFDAPTFKTNLIAAINGTAPNTTASPFFVAASASSVASVATNTTFTASGGTDGTSGVTSTTLEGTDGNGSRTGMYALRGMSFGGLILAGNTDLTVAANMATFLAQTGGIGFVAFPSGTSTASAISTKITNGVAFGRIVPCQDWDYVNDSLSGNSNLLVSPMGAIAACVLSQPPYMDPSNKPGAGKSGIVATERTYRSQPVDPLSEGAQRQANGIMWLTNANQGAGGLWRLPHGQASDGSDISDTRMLDFIAAEVLDVLGQFVGQMQTNPPAAGQVDTDPTRLAAEGALHSLFRPLEDKTAPQIQAYDVRYTGTLTQVQNGYLPFAIDVTTLSGVKYALAYLQVGKTVWIPQAA